MTFSGTLGPAAHVAPHVGRRRVVGSCLDDEADELEARSFQSPIPRDRLPAVVDLRRWLPPVETESDLGASAASALSCAVEYLITRGTGHHVDVSRLFLYYNQRLWGRHVREDRGASIRSGIRVLSRLGVPSERAWPYAIDLFAVQPPESVYVAAARHRIADWAKLPVDLDLLRGALAGGLPVVTSLRVGPTFVDLDAGGRVPLAAVPEREGRHALLLVGYSSAERVFLARNSWGTDWGHRGYCYLPFELLLAPGAIGACWVVRTSAGLAFDAAEHAAPELGALPKAPPPSVTAAGAGGAPAPGGLFPPTAFSQGATAPGPGGGLFPAAAFPVAGGGAPPPMPPPPMPPPVGAGLAASPAPDLGGGAGWMSLLGSAAAVVGGRKTPLQLALDLASQHSGGLVAKYTGSEVAGRVVGGLVGQVAPTVAGPGGISSLSLASLGTAVAGAAFGGGQATGGPPPPGAIAPPPGPASPPPAVDPGTVLGSDLTPRILAILQAPAPAAALERHAWDDGWDETAAPAASLPASPPAPPQPPPAPPQPPPAPPPSAATAGGEGTRALVERWRALGAESGALGRATGGERALAGGGRAVVCERGAIVWSPAHGAHDVRGTILDAWLRAGAESGPLGHPTAGELQVPHGAALARLARFERGLIVDWDGAHDLAPFLLLSGDAPFDAWAAAGAERGPAGVPIGAPFDLETGERVLPCASGAVGWSPIHGTAVLTGERYAAWQAAIARAR